MKRTSFPPRQADLLSRSRSATPDLFIVNLFNFLERRERDEPLDPEWVTLYERIEKIAKRKGVAPGFVFERIENALKSVSITDPGIKDLSLGPDQRLAILLGAGASAPEPSSIPTVLKLLPELWRRATKIGRDDIDKLRAWCDSHGVTNIEDLLTAAYIANFSARNSYVTGLLDYFLFSSRRAVLEEEGKEEGARYRIGPGDQAAQVDIASIALFQDTLQTLFGLLMSTMIPARPNAAHKAIADLLTRHPRTSIITTIEGNINNVRSVLSIAPQIAYLP